MFNLLMAALGLFSAFPKPDLFSIDIGSIRAGAGIVLNEYYGHFFLIPDISLSVGQAKLYWGKDAALVTGFELFRLENAGATEIGFWGASECLTPEVGISKMIKPIQTIQPKGCMKLFKSESFAPRLDLVCGFSPVNLLALYSSSATYSPTLRVELKLFISSSLQLILENRNMWFYYKETNDVNTFNSFHLSLCYSLGADYPNCDSGGEPKE